MIKIFKKKLCKNCRNIIIEENKLYCNKFLISNNRYIDIYDFASNVRRDEKKCGKFGKYYENNNKL